MAIRNVYLYNLGMVLLVGLGLVLFLITFLGSLIIFSSPLLFLIGILYLVMVNNGYKKVSTLLNSNDAFILREYKSKMYNLLIFQVIVTLIISGIIYVTIIGPPSGKIPVMYFENSHIKELFNSPQIFGFFFIGSSFIYHLRFILSYKEGQKEILGAPNHQNSRNIDDTSKIIATQKIISQAKIFESQKRDDQALTNYLKAFDMLKCEEIK